MNAKIFTFIIVLFLQLTALSAGEIDFSKIAPHPRLYMKAGAEEKIRGDILKNPEMNAVHLSLIKAAGEIRQKPLLKRNQVGFRILHTSREMLRRMSLLGYAWRMTGDKSYAERAKEEILNVSTFENWNPSHFLDTAEMAFAFAIAYDWFYGAFDADTKALISGEIVNKAFKPFRAGKYFWYGGKNANNWNQVCNSGLLCAATAIYETDAQMCKSIINDTLKDVQRGLRDCYSKDGAYVEGFGYWNYGTGYQIYMLEALLSAFGTDAGLYEKYPQLLKSAKFILHMVGNSGSNFNFFDSGAGKKYANALIVFFAKKTGDTSLLWQQKDCYKADKSSAKDFMSLFMLIAASDINFKNVPVPQELSYKALEGDNPLFITRSAWDSDAPFLALKGGHATINHGHMDASSFVFDALGERWAFDMGAQDYNSLEKLGMKIWGANSKKTDGRWKVWRYTNYVHNMLTVNDSLINPTAFIKITDTFERENESGASLDTTALYAPQLKSAKRTVSIVDGKFLRVKDTLENGDKPSKISWRMCTYKNAQLIDAESIKITSKSGKILIAKLVSPKGFKAEILSADSGNSWDAKNPDYALATFSGILQPNQKEEIIVELIPQR